MPASTAAALFDVALYSSTAKAIPYSQGPSSLPGFDSHHTWDSTTKSHTLIGLPLQVATLSTYSVASSVVTLTATATLGSGFTVGSYVTILVSDGNTWLNGTWRIDGLGTATQFVVVIAHADSSGGVTGTATVNPQMANLHSCQAGDGTDLFKVGPLGSVTINGSVRNAASLLDIRKNAPSGSLMMRFFPVGSDPLTYVTDNGAIYSHSEFCSSGSSSGSGDSYTINPPISGPFMIGTYMDVFTGIPIRDSGQPGSQAIQILDHAGNYVLGIRAASGKIEWGSTTSVDINGTPLFDCNIYRKTAGHLATDSVLTSKVTTGQGPNAYEILGTLDALLYFVDSLGNLTINNSNSRITFGSGNNAAVYHDGSNAAWQVNVGSLSLSTQGADKDVTISAAGHLGLVVHGATGKARIRLSAPETALDDNNLATSQLGIWLNESTNRLTFRVRYSDGTTLKTGEVALA